MYGISAVSVFAVVACGVGVVVDNAWCELFPKGGISAAFNAGLFNAFASTSLLALPIKGVSSKFPGDNNKER